MLVTLDIKVKFMEIVTMLENSILTLSFMLEDICNILMFSKNNVAKLNRLVNESIIRHILLYGSKR